MHEHFIHLAESPINAIEEDDAFRIGAEIYFLVLLLVLIIVLCYHYRRDPSMAYPHFAHGEAAATAYPHHIPTSRMSPPRFATNSDAIEVRPQLSMVIDRPEQHSFKRARMIDNNHSDALPCPPHRVMQPPPQSNRGTGHIFYKTRTCTRFTFGNCRNGDNCNFAHGEEELRQPPPNWQDYVGPHNERKEERVQVPNWDDDQKIIHKMKPCKKFYNGEQCPYGEKCSFLHEDPAKFRADSWKSRECSAISIGTIGSPKSFGDGSGNLEGNSGVTKQPKGTYWKTKLCTMWQNTGSCPFGDDCHFAHEEAELQAPGGGIEAEAAVAIANSPKASVPASPNALSVSANVESAALPASLPVATEDEKTKKNILIWSGLNKRKINNIYADCPEDIVPLPNFPSAIESWPENTVHWYNFMVRDMCVCQFLRGVSMDFKNFCGILGWINIDRISPNESSLLNTGLLQTTKGGHSLPFLEHQQASL